MARPGAGAYATRVWAASCSGDYAVLGALGRAAAPLDAVPAALRRLLEELSDATGEAAFLVAVAQEERPYLGDTVASSGWPTWYGGPRRIGCER